MREVASRVLVSEYWLNLNIHNPGNSSINADGILRYLAEEGQSSGWNSLANRDAARAKAALGFVVIGGLKSNEFQVSYLDKDGKWVTKIDYGHVVIVTAEQSENAYYPKAYWGSIGGVDKASGPLGSSISKTFRQADLGNVHYYYSEPGT